MSETDYDVIVAGGGPGGSTAAHLLAAAGKRVLVIEREHFPRFHIGESLLPVDLPLFERLGVDMANAGFLRKSGARFIDERTGQALTFSFDAALPGTPHHAYQVDRAQFDDLLLRRAIEVGAEVRFGVSVEAVEFDDADKVVVRAGGETLGARYFVDATGTKTFMARRNKSLEPKRGFGRAAAFRRYGNLAADVVAELHGRGDIWVLMIEKGWVWIIPLPGESLSIGVVSTVEKVDHAFFDRQLAASPTLQRVTKGAAILEQGTVGNWSYANTQPDGPRWSCVGDSASFLDPIFSSGVTLALLMAEQVVEHLVPALDAGTEADPELMRPVREHVGRGYQIFERFIERFYDADVVHRLFFSELRNEEVVQGITTVLAGDLWRDDNVFQGMLERSRRRGR